LKTHQIFPITFELQDKEVIFDISICLIIFSTSETENKKAIFKSQEDAVKYVETRERVYTLQGSEAMKIKAKD